MSKLFIPIIEGTTRPTRLSMHVTKYIHSLVQTYEDVESLVIDPGQFTLPYDGNDDGCRDPRYSEITARADAFFIVVPEYNHSFPGSLKRLLDSESKNYIHKPVAFAGVTSGPWGGTRGVEALVTAVREMGLIATFTDVQFPHVQKLFSETGEILDPAYEARVKKSYTELIWMAKTLKWGRENLTV